MKSNVKQLRLERHLSQAQLAERLGVSRQTVHVLERGKAEPSLRLAMRIAWTFEKRIEEIFSIDLEEKLEILGAEWAYSDRLATAFNEIGVLDEMGREGWELTGFGVGILRFRRPLDTPLRIVWAYRRTDGALSNVSRAALEDEGWAYCGSWLGLFHYFKRAL